MSSSLKTTCLAFLLIAVFQSTLATVPPGAPTTRRWKATVYSQDGKHKGLLYSVTDSSLTLLHSAQYTEIQFRNIDRIRLRKRKRLEEPALIGMVIGSAAGTVVGVLTTPKRDDVYNDGYEDSRRLADAFLRGFLGSIAGALLGAGIGWGIAALFGGKKFTVYHDKNSYTVLRSKLERYSMR